MELFVVIESGDHEKGPKKYLADLQNPFEKYDSEEFIQRFAFSKESCLDLFKIIKDDEQLKVRAHSVPPVIQLLAAMQFLVSGLLLKNNAWCMGMSRATAGHIVHRITTCIARRRSKFIRFPDPSTCKQNMQDFYKIAAFPSVVGVLGCTHIPILRPPVEKGGKWDAFDNKEGVPSINMQAICGPDKTFSNIVARWPGSVSDSRIFEKSTIRKDFEERKISGFLVGGGQYLCNEYLMTSICTPSTVAEEAYNESHLATLSCISQAFDMLKQRFRVLDAPIRMRLDNTLAVIVATACLHNFAIKTAQDVVKFEDADIVDEELFLADPPSSRQELISKYFDESENSLSMCMVEISHD